MVQARIYRPTKTVMQSGKVRCRQWILEFCPKGLQFTDPLMGWYGSKDTRHHLRLTFRSLESAVAYAKKESLDVEIEASHPSRMIPKQYADNFRYDRVG
jgi:hypothetical protein